MYRDHPEGTRLGSIVEGVIVCCPNGSKIPRSVSSGNSATCELIVVARDCLLTVTTAGIDFRDPKPKASGELDRISQVAFSSWSNSLRMWSNRYQDGLLLLSGVFTHSALGNTPIGKVNSAHSCFRQSEVSVFLFPL